jgi:uncharacterized protein (DUF2126 family)
LHYGQGKWYPGESLPRWAFGLYWRKDGVPIWKNADLIAKIDNPRKAVIEEAKAFMEGTAKRLGLDAGYVMPAYEDSVHWLQKEAALPVNVDPADSKLADPEERARMARVFDEGLNKPKGFVLPIQRAGADASSWMSERWQLRRGHLFLIPGDSPLGLRLPMASLPHVPPEEFPYLVEQDPMEPRLELAEEDKEAAAGGVPARLAEKPKPKPKPVRTAASVEIRERRAVRLHAAGREGRRLSRTDRGSGSDRRGTAAPGSCRRLWAALRSAHRGDQGDARSRRDRNQRPAGAKLARGGRYHLRAV